MSQRRMFRSKFYILGATLGLGLLFALHNAPQSEDANVRLASTAVVSANMQTYAQCVKEEEAKLKRFVKNPTAAQLATYKKSADRTCRAKGLKPAVVVPAQPAPAQPAEPAPETPAVPEAPVVPAVDPATLPDFQTLSAGYTADRTAIYAEFRNAGATQIDRSHFGRVSILLEGMRSASTARLDLEASALFEAGGTYRYELPLTGDLARYARGSYQMTACADTYNDYVESIEDNNCMSMQIVGESLPDFAIENVALNLADGVFAFDVVNLGGELTERYQVMAGVTLNPEGNYVDVGYFSEGNMPGIRTAGTRAHVELTFDRYVYLKRLLIGDHTLRVCVAQSEYIPQEVTKENNCVNFLSEGAEEAREFSDAKVSYYPGEVFINLTNDSSDDIDYLRQKAETDTMKSIYICSRSSHTGINSCQRYDRYTFD